MACSLARTLDVAGEWWTPLILRDLWLGRRRFEEIQANLEVSRKLLADRLETLVREGIVERRLYQERPPIGGPPARPGRPWLCGTSAAGRRCGPR
jgi:DNA-binding HxlR family transcriptional regulator